jgi:hypothetical protein
MEYMGDSVVGNTFSSKTSKMGITFQNKRWVQNVILPKYVILHETRHCYACPNPDPTYFAPWIVIFD